MFLATNSFLPAPAPPHLLSLSTEEVDAYYMKKYSGSYTALDRVFYVDELRRTIAGFL